MIDIQKNKNTQDVSGKVAAAQSKQAGNNAPTGNQPVSAK